MKCRCIRPAMHPACLRCSSVTYSRYFPSSRLLGRAPHRSRCNADFHHGLLRAVIRVDVDVIRAEITRPDGAGSVPARAEIDGHLDLLAREIVRGRRLAVVEHRGVREQDDRSDADRRAYSDDRCLGRTRADLERLGLELPDPGATLQPREMERLADFLMAKVIGLGPMNRAACVDYWGEEVEVCAELPD